MSTMSRRTVTSRAKASPSRNGHAPGALFDGYLDSNRPHSQAYDEMFAETASVRSAYRTLYDSLVPSQASDLAARSEALDRAFVDQGITFSLSGQERPFPLDLIPRVIAASEWSKLERGIVQRVRAMEMFLADVYGDVQIVRDGVLPRRLITSCAHYQREAVGISPPNGVRIH